MEIKKKGESREDDARRPISFVPYSILHISLPQRVGAWRGRGGESGPIRSPGGATNTTSASLYNQQVAELMPTLVNVVMERSEGGREERVKGGKDGGTGEGREGARKRRE